MVSKASVGAGWQRAILTLTGTVVGVVVVGTLYWAQSVFIPVALAALPDVPAQPAGQPAPPARAAADAVGDRGRPAGGDRPGRRRLAGHRPDQQPAPRAAQVPRDGPGQGPEAVKQATAGTERAPGDDRGDHHRRQAGAAHDHRRRCRRRRRRRGRPEGRGWRGGGAAPARAGRADRRDPRAAAGRLDVAADLVPQPAAGVPRRAGPGDHPGHLHAAEARGAAQPDHPAGGPRQDRRRHQVRRRGGAPGQPLPADAGDRQRDLRRPLRPGAAGHRRQVRPALGLPGGHAPLPALHRPLPGRHVPDLAEPGDVRGLGRRP